MLVVTRKIGETIEVGDGIVITLVEINGRSVRIGVTAPRDVPVLRGELAARDRSAGRQPATGGDRNGR